MPSFKSSLFVAAAALTSVVSAQVDETTYPFQAPGATDYRSPCPGLNTLANHGILPRDGKNLDIPTIAAAALLAYNISTEAVNVFGALGLAASTTGDAKTFHLKDLAQHDPQVLEHDASMTRNDSYFGDNLAFSETANARTVASWGTAATITFKVAKDERAARFAWATANNPDFNQTFAEPNTLLEYALALSTFGDAVDGNGNAAYIKYWMENERLPMSLGWKTPAKQLTVASAQTMARAIAAAV